jgi:hypothetical protein
MARMIAMRALPGEHRQMRKLVIALLLVVVASARPARAESIGIGLFVGEPVGLDLKIGLQHRGALDVVIGESSINDGRVSYGHLTYLHLLTVAHGSSVNLPLRLGIGGAVYGVTEEFTAFAARVPFELGIRFRSSPLEIYGEITFVLQLFAEGQGDDIDTDIDGGVGLRVYF